MVSKSIIFVNQIRQKPARRVYTLHVIKIILQDGACLFKPKKDFICVPLLQNVATGLYLSDFNVMVFFELTHLTMKAIIIVIVSIKHCINLFIHIFKR